MNSDKIFTDVGLSVERISGEEFPDEILPVVGPADYDMNVLFYCSKT